MDRNRISDDNLDSFIGVKLPLSNSQYGYFNPSILTIEQIKSNIKSLILTKKHERVFEDISCHIQGYLFEPISEYEINEAVKSNIENKIEKYFPGLYTRNIQVKSDKEKNIIYIYLEFSLDREIYEELTFKILG